MSLEYKAYKVTVLPLKTEALNSNPTALLKVIKAHIRNRNNHSTWLIINPLLIEWKSLIYLAINFSITRARIPVSGRSTHNLTSRQLNLTCSKRLTQHFRLAISTKLMR